MNLISPFVEWRGRDASVRASKWFPATVPGCVHTDLHRSGVIPDPFYGTNELDLQWIEEHTWEYRATFDVPASLLDCEVIELCADGLDTVASLYLNGENFASTENMFTAYRFAVKPLLRLKRNELRVIFHSALDYIRTTRAYFSPPCEFNDPVGNSVRIRKQQSQFGWDWGPRLVTAGIWQNLRLEGWNANRLANLSISQTHRPNGVVRIAVTPRTDRSIGGGRYRLTIKLRDEVISSVESAGPTLTADIQKPELWWPAGHGEQTLYDLEVLALDGTGAECGRLVRRIGLRTLVLDRSPDRLGERFRFLVNRQPIFVKGANWIPAHSFVTTLTRDVYARDLRSAVSANMNCVRVWGGGIYESEHFYDLCDELGLLVWQDFMFACNLYPADTEFLALVKTEAEQQVARLHHHPCLALWCGNNEIVMLNGEKLRADTSLQRDYKSIFHRLLPDIVAKYDGVTPYWSSSEWRGTFENGHALGEKTGDTHFWDVWHKRSPVKEYEKWRFRFVSEFGMQSYSSPATNETFCPPGHDNVFGPEMENHQKNRAGNQIILDYVSRRYRFPKNQEALIILSQLNQAYCMKTGVEHYRRLMPHCMGAIYWQLNDCWPVASWSSIEFTGRWKALHHEARRFFSPALVTAQIIGEEESTTGNYRRSSVREVHIYTIYESRVPARGLLRWDLYHLDNTIILSGKKRIALQSGKSFCQTVLDLSKHIAIHGRERLYLRLALDIKGQTVSEDTVLLVPPRFMELPQAKLTTVFTRISPTEVRLAFAASHFLHRFHFEFFELNPTMSDNYFDLYPGEPKEVLLFFDQPVTKLNIRHRLRTASLRDTY